MPARIAVDADWIADFCRRHGIAELSLFGSVLRDDFGPASDVDVLVEFAPERTPGYFGLMEMEDELVAAVGRRVDLVSKRGLRGGIREHVLANREVQYVAPERQGVPDGRRRGH